MLLNKSFFMELGNKLKIQLCITSNIKTIFLAFFQFLKLLLRWKLQTRW